MLKHPPSRHRWTALPCAGIRILYARASPPGLYKGAYADFDPASVQTGCVLCIMAFRMYLHPIPSSSSEFLDAGLEDSGHQDLEDNDHPQTSLIRKILC